MVPTTFPGALISFCTALLAGPTRVGGTLRSAIDVSSVASGANRGQTPTEPTIVLAIRVLHWPQRPQQVIVRCVPRSFVCRGMQRTRSSNSGSSPRSGRTPYLTPLVVQRGAGPRSQAHCRPALEGWGGADHACGFHRAEAGLGARLQMRPRLLAFRWQAVAVAPLPRRLAVHSRFHRSH